MTVRRLQHRVRITLIAVGIVACSGMWLSAQGTTGSIAGSVYADGSGIPAATVTVTSSVLQGSRGAGTDSSGHFILGKLPPGSYELTLDAPGFASIRRTVVVEIGKTSDMSVTLTSAPITEAITVTAEAPPVTAGASSTEVDKLPVPSRNPFNAIPELVSPSGQFGVNQNQIRVSGGFAFDSLLRLDGADVADNLFGDNQNLFIEDAIQETQVQTAGISTQYGRFSGGIVNVVTKSGGNDFHGTFRLDFSNRNWSAATPADRPVDSGGSDVRTYQGTLGGLIVRDRLWFFAAGRTGSVKEQREFATTAIPFTSSVDSTRFSGKLTAQLAPGHSLIGSYLGTTNDEVFARDNSVTPSTLLSPTTKGQLFVGNYTGILTENFFAEAQYSEKTFKFTNAGGTSTDPHNSPYFTLDTTVNVFNPVFNGLAENERNNRQFGASTSYFLSTRSLGTHTLKGGYEHFSSTRIESPARSSTGVTFFTNYQTNQGRILLDASNRPTPIWTPNSSFIFVNPVLTSAVAEATTNSFYAEDSWKVRPNLTLKLGIRYEHSSLEANDTSVASSNDVAPRVGVAWSPSFRSGFLTKIFGDYSRYSGRYDIKQSSGGLFGDQGHFRLYTGASGTGLNFAPAFDFAKSYGTAFPVDQAATTKVDPGLGTPVVDEFMVGTEFQILEDLRLGLSYVHRSYGRVIEDLAPNGSPTFVTSGGGTAQADSTLVTNSTSAVRRYDALELRLEKQFFDNFFANMNYTYSRLYGNYTGETASGSPDTSVAGDYPAIFNATRHFPETDLPGSQNSQLRVSTIYSIPAGSATLDIGSVLRVDSGRNFVFQSTIPLTSIQKSLATAAGNINAPTTQTLFFNNEVGHFEGDKRLDLSATYTRPLPSGQSLWLKADVFNVFNNLTKQSFSTTIVPGGPNDALGLPTTFTKASTFGSATSRQDFTLPRTFGISAGIKF